jgi:ABC-type uncharacterized transport system substrate-binding protein
MQRRAFILALGGAAAAWPLAARAQQPTMPVIGFLNSASAAGYGVAVRGFHQGLKEAGFIEGQNVAIEYRWAEGQYDRLPALASDLARRQVAVIVANTSAILPARAATSAIPIVFTTSLDPVQRGLVASLSRPGGNVTGVYSLNVEVGQKRLELLHEVIPAATTIAFLVNPANPNVETLSRDLKEAAGRLGLQLHVLRASSERDFDNVFATVRTLGAGALVIGTDSLFNSWSERLAALTVRHALPTIYQTREFAAAGGLMSYGGLLAESYRLVGVSAGRILAGANPADLPVQQATKIELFINLKTAKALGITMPLPLLGRADEVIE